MALDDPLPPSTRDPDAAAARLLSAPLEVVEEPDWSESKRELLEGAGAVDGG